MNPTYSTFDTLSIGDISPELALQHNQSQQNDQEPSSQSHLNEEAADSSTARHEPKVVARLPRLQSRQLENKQHADESLEEHRSQSLREKTLSASPSDANPAVTNPAAAKTAEADVAETKIERLFKQRIDSAASPLHRNDQGYQGQPLGSNTQEAFDEDKKSKPSINLALDELAVFRKGLRFDTFPVSGNDSQVIDLEQDELVEPTIAIAPETLPEPIVQRPAKVGLASETDHWSDSWLLRLEAAVMPYSRVIVFVAVVTALGLTFLLLQGNPTAEVGDSVKPTPMADHLQKTSQLTSSNEEPEAAPIEASSNATLYANNQNQPVIIRNQPSINQPGIIDQTATRSSGPKGLPFPTPINAPAASTQLASTQSTMPAPRAQLAGNIMPVAPYRTTYQTMPLPATTVTNTNGLPVNYPQTANANSQWPTASQGGTIR